MNSLELRRMGNRLIETGELLIEMADEAERQPDPAHDLATVRNTGRHERKPRWIGPASPAVLKDRWTLRAEYVQLQMQRGADTSQKFFAQTHNLSPSELSRWLSEKPRGIEPGGTQDENIRRAYAEAIGRLKAQRAKRHGAAV